MQQFDVIVIGSGVAAQTVGVKLAQAGKRVAVTDKREYGGTCALRGCEPKKVIYSATELVERAQAQAASGLSGSIGIDWSELIAFKRTFTEPMPPMIEQMFRSSGVTTLHGTGRFVSESAVEIAGERYEFDTAVICTGSVPRPLGMPGAGHVLDSEAFMATETLGEHVVFIGGGYISFEFAHMAHAAGSRVTILHRSEHVLSGFDTQLADLLADAYRDSGIDVRVNAPVSEVRATSDGFEVVCGNGDVVPCDMVIHGAGRVPDLDALELDAAGVTAGRHGIDVDDTLRSMDNPRVYAAGDAASLGLPLTPVATAQARIVVANILEPGSARFDGSVTPSVVFADPPFATVGLTEEAAAHLDVEVTFNDTTSWASSRRLAARISAAKTIVERDTGRIVGAHLLGPGAEEVINVIAIAMRGGLTAADLRTAVWAYPTHGSDIAYLF